ncbi:hypothetical protein E2P81_ATG01795 [Venturia nashicola]|nr:hypothetical protein E2P81_ATG01795 [Venturia nashicola]
MKLPTELRHQIYDHVEAACLDQPETNWGAERDHVPAREIMPVVENGYLDVDASEKLALVPLHPLRTWLSKRKLTIQNLGKANSEFKKDVEDYFCLQRSRPPFHPDVILRFGSLKQLGELLLEIEHLGRQRITSIEFEWNEEIEAGYWSPFFGEYTALPMYDILYRKDTSAKVFTLLADCSNLRSLKIGIDPYIVSRVKHGPWCRAGLAEVLNEEEQNLFDLDGSRALHNVRLGPHAFVELEYRDTARLRERFSLPPSAAPPSRYLEWLRDGMLRPRDQQDVNARIRDMKLDIGFWKILLHSLIETCKSQGGECRDHLYQLSAIISCKCTKKYLPYREDVSQRVRYLANLMTDHQASDDLVWKEVVEIADCMESSIPY